MQRPVQAAEPGKNLWNWTLWVAHHLDSALGMINAAASAIAAVAILASAAVIAANVLARQLFFRPLVDSLQIGQLVMVFIAYLALAHNVRNGRHVRATLLYDRLGQRARALLDVATGIISLGAVGVVIWQGSVFALEAADVGARLLGGLVLPALPFHFAVPAMFALLELELLRTLIYDLNKVFRSPTAESAAE